MSSALSRAGCGQASRGFSLVISTAPGSGCRSEGEDVCRGPAGATASPDRFLLARLDGAQGCLVCCSPSLSQLPPGWSVAERNPRPTSSAHGASVSCPAVDSSLTWVLTESQSRATPALACSRLRGCQNSRLLPPKMRQGSRQLTLPQRSLFVGGYSGSLPVISRLNLIISLRSRYYHHPHFIENTKAQRGSVTSKVGLRASPVAQQ